MWLDRLAGHASPAVHSPSHSTAQSQRSYSPAGRRPSHLAPQQSQQNLHRPIYGPRSSSLTSASNDSNISLLSNSNDTQKAPNGSNLRQVSRQDDSQDPLKLLDRLLGSTPAPAESEDTKDDEPSLEDIDFEGLSLSGFVKVDKPVQRQRSQSIVECQYIVLDMPCSQAYIFFRRARQVHIQ